jgi:hypothetical protein
MVGGDPLRAKCAHDEKTILVYLANPTDGNPETDNPGAEKPSATIDLPSGKWGARWFNPRTGEWTAGKPIAGGASRKLTAPHEDRSTAGDWVLLLRRK